MILTLVLFRRLRAIDGKMVFGMGIAKILPCLVETYGFNTIRIGRQEKNGLTGLQIPCQPIDVHQSGLYATGKAQDPKASRSESTK
jgi:hypothetical protein